MISDLENIIKKLIHESKTISTMESCTGGMISNAITNIEGSSEVFKFGAVTYSNEYKIKFGVNSKTIDKYSVYSIEVAREMSKAISNYTKSDYGIGVTGKLNRADKNNNYGDDNRVFVSFYDRYNDKYSTFDMVVTESKRSDNKTNILIKLIDLIKENMWLKIF